jgi:hypothetical protein
MVLCNYHHKAYEAQNGNAPSGTPAFDEWAVINFGDNWMDELSITQARAMYRDFLISEWPLEID